MYNHNLDKYTNLCIMLTMSLIEHAPQKEKIFDTRKQNENENSEQKGHNTDKLRDDNWYKEFQRQSISKAEDAIFKNELAELNVDYTSSSTELEAAADLWLDESASHATTFEPFIPLSEMTPYELETDEDGASENETDYNRTVSDVEVGLDSLAAIKAERERRATLDTYADDDLGDKQFFDSGMHVIKPKIPKA